MSWSGRLRISKTSTYGPYRLSDSERDAVPCLAEMPRKAPMTASRRYSIATGISSLVWETALAASTASSPTYNTIDQPLCVVERIGAIPARRISLARASDRQLSSECGQSPLFRS